MQFAAYMLAIALFAIAIALWRNDRLGYWLNLSVVSGADIIWVLVVVLPGYVPLHVVSFHRHPRQERVPRLHNAVTGGVGHFSCAVPFRGLRYPPFGYAGYFVSVAPETRLDKP